MMAYNRHKDGYELAHKLSPQLNGFLNYLLNFIRRKVTFRESALVNSLVINTTPSIINKNNIDMLFVIKSMGLLAAGYTPSNSTVSNTLYSIAGNKNNLIMLFGIQLDLALKGTCLLGFYFWYFA